LAELRTLHSRVARSTALVSALVGLLASAGAVLLVHDQLRTADDRRLREAAQLFANEMGETEPELTERGNAEAKELEPVGLRLAVFRGARQLGGARVEGSPLEPGCRTNAKVRSCAVAAPAGTIVVEGQASELPTGLLAVVAALVALVAALGGALASRVVARWALEPLHSLQARLASVSLAEALELGPPATTAEVEAFRQAITGLVARLKEASERSRVFASGAAHELRTPLATLSAELELAAPEASGATREALARAQRTVGRLAVLVDHLLLLSRGEAPGTASFETLALEDLVRETVATRSSAERARLCLAFDDPGMVRGDAVLLGAIVDNLVDNALKFTPAGPVSVRVGAAGAGVLLEVHDPGPGLTQEAFTALQKPFSRGAGSGKIAGHGLGLAIVHHAVELHAGALRFDGPTVTVTLPGWRPLADGGRTA